MSKAMTKTDGLQPIDALASDIERVVVGGDLAALNPEQRVIYYQHICKRMGIDAATRPFDYIQLNGKTVLYANRNAAEQLRRNGGVSIEITSRDLKGSVFIVSAKATDKIGRSDEAIGAVSIGGLTGDALANAYMKAETKAKRRVTLSICGLGMLDESEVETVTPRATIKPPPRMAASAQPQQENE